MRKVLVVENGVIVGLRERTKEEAYRIILDDDYVDDTIGVGKEVADLIANTLFSFQSKIDYIRQSLGSTLAEVFSEGVEAERDRAKTEEEIGEEVGLVNPYGKR